MYTIQELRTRAESTLNDLISGKIDPDTASTWAYDIYRNKNEEEIINSSVSLAQLFDSLIMSNFRHNKNGPLMFDKITYETWLKDYYEELDNEQIETGK